MTDPREPEPNEARLQALFTRTAERPTGAQLTKLAARAAEVPTRARARAGVPYWVLGPVVALAAAGVLYVAVPRGSRQVPVAEVAPRAERPALAPSYTAGAMPPAPLADEEDVFAASGAFTFGGDELDPLGGDLEGPVSDAELDAWLAATDEILNGG